jgi:DNA-binding LacI/PurR family transcriptional regulator
MCQGARRDEVGVADQGSTAREPGEPGGTARRAGPDRRPGRRVRLKDVAARAGVSTGLVSLVLRNQPGPGAQARVRVFQAAQDLGYRPDRSASLLARRRSHHLGVMMDLRDTFHAELVAELDQAATELGYDLVLGTLTPARDERRALEILLDFRCEALILLGPQETAARLNSLGTQLPVVVIGRRVPDPTVDVVRAADDQGVALAVGHLAALGHRDIAFVDGGRGAVASDRRKGYRQAMRELGLAAGLRVVPGGLAEAAGARAAAALFDGERPPTAVVTSGDRTAMGLLDGLARRGLPVPGAVSVVGYDDSLLARLAHVDLTTVSQQAGQQARQAVALAVDRLENGRPTPREIVLSPRLVVRGTTAAPAAAGPVTARPAAARPAAVRPAATRAAVYLGF